MKKEQPVNIQVLKIKEVAFSVNESYEGNSENPDMNFDFLFNTDIPSNVVGLSIDIHIHPQGDHEVELISSRSITSFKVNPLQQFSTNQSDGEAVVDLPDGLLAMLLGIAFSHARAMLAMKTAATKYNNVVLPIINPTKVIKQISDDTSSKAESPETKL